MKFIISFLLIFSLAVQSSAQSDWNIEIINEFIRNLNGTRSNLEIMKQFVHCNDYFTSDKLKVIADDWLDYLRLDLEKNNSFSVSKYNQDRGIEFGITSVRSEKIEIIDPNDIYEVRIGDSSSVLYIYIKNNKIISFTGFEIGNKVGMIAF